MRPACLLAVAVLSAPAPALAHAVGLSTASVRAADRQVTAELAFARAELSTWRAEELVAAVAVSSSGRPCPAAGWELNPLERDGLQLVVRLLCPAPPLSLTYGLPLLQQLGHGHRHLVTLSLGGQEQRSVLHRAQSTLTVAGVASEPAPSAWGRLLAMGVEHILTGWDHLVFLLGLLLVAGRLPDLLRTVTAFTVGHSLTLACGALGFYSPGPRWVEPLIALSIAWVGVENIFFRKLARRWPTALAFGLIHGFGFSGALAELALPRADLLPALLAFNLGVEAGQLAVVALVVPLLALARRWEPFRRYGTPALGGAIIVPGLVWFVARLGVL
jgi:hydrogenase/urease accessory protein HupE